MKNNHWPFRPKLIDLPTNSALRLDLIESAKKQGNIRFHRSLSEPVSLIVPTYNVSQFIDQFLWSIVTQTTGLKNVEVIVVDDGSTDETAAIVKLWEVHFPDTIKYVFQANTGLSGARNKGLDLATGTWVSFPDPDDFVARTYFAQMDKEIRRNHTKPLLFIAAKLVLYWENNSVFNDRHALRFRFRVKRKELPTSDLKNYMQLQVCSAWFKRSVIEKHGRKFDQRVKPTFEDGHFIYHLMMREPDLCAVFLSSAVYYYRKRESGTSLVDASRSKTDWYLDQLEFGPLDIANEAKKRFGFVPVFIQRVILYETKWRFEHLMDRPDRSEFLSKPEHQKSWALLAEIMSHVEPSTVADFSPPYLQFKHKIACSTFSTQKSDLLQTVQVVDYDQLKKRLLLKYFSRLTVPKLKVTVKGIDCRSCFPSQNVHSVLGQEYLTERQEWFEVAPNQHVEITLNGAPAHLKHSGQRVGKFNQTTIDQLLPLIKRRSLRKKVRLALKLSRSSAMRTKYHNCWVFMDRDDRADDNAEHLYRYMLTSGHKQDCYFVLRKNSTDWIRLEREGFNLIDFMSDDHIAAILHAQVLASSHIDHFILWPTDMKSIRELAHFKFVFLQHGVIKDDLSNWLNTKQISLMVTSTKDEFDSITALSSNYLLSKANVALCGLARHDFLLSRSREKTCIVIMPTWRKYLTDETKRSAMARKKVVNFKESEFFINWSRILNSKKLKQIAENHRQDIVFCLHPNFEMYLNEFDLPDFIRKWHFNSSESLQELFAQTSVMITDYSSTAFDVAFLDRPIIYFQFDREQFFSGEHVYQKGYFDYQIDGFGPVTIDPNDTLIALETALSGAEDPKFAMKRARTYAHRDGRNCERTIEAINNLV